MASSFTQIYQYARPDNVDVSSLVKAQTYKQQSYDTNVAQTQQLINQYVGTDLIRGVDQQYLGERLSALTNYINMAGAQDWSRRTVAADVQNYVGQALDENVMAGIASTQRYRKQMAEIEDIKKNKPDLYSAQNEWFATRDLQRYMKSGKLGDSYNANAYVPYTDVNKLIVESLPKLKEFMVDVKWTSDGQPLLTRMDKHEVLSQEEAAGYLNMILGEKGNSQLAIDGMYKYRSYTTDDIRKIYKEDIGNNIKQYDEQAKSMDVLQVGKTDAEKKAYKERATQLRDQAGQLRNFQSEVDKMDADTIAQRMYTSNYKQGWSKLLSFDRVTDWKIDDRNFQIAKRNDDLAYKAWEKSFAEDKFMAEQTWKLKDYELEKAKAISKGEIVIDPLTGQPVANASYGMNSSGINTVNKTDELGKEKQVLAEDIYDNYSIAYKSAVQEVTGYVKELQSTEQGRKILKEHYGDIDQNDVNKLVHSMMRGDKDSQLRLSGISNIMNKSEQGQRALDAISNSISAYRQTKAMDVDLEEAKKGLEKITAKIMSADNLGGKFFGLDNMIIDKNGKAVKGSYLNKDYYDPNFTEQQKLGALIGTISNRLLQPGDITEAEKSSLRVLQKKLIGQIKDPDARKAFQSYSDQQSKSNTFLNYLGHDMSELGQRIRADWNRVTYWATGNEEDLADLKDAQKTIAYNQKSKQLYANQRAAKRTSIFSTDYTIDALDSNDLQKGNSTISFGRTSEGYNSSGNSAYRSEVGSHLERLHNRLQSDKFITAGGKIINIDTEIKGNAPLKSWAKQYFPSEIQNNANISVDINMENGTATITAPIKDGKEYVQTPSAPIPIKELPPQLLRQTSFGGDEYNPQNPNARTFYARGQVYENSERISDLYGDVEINPYANRKTVEQMVQDVKANIGENVYEKHKAEIDKIIRTPVDIEAKRVGNVYVVDTKIGTNIVNRETVPTNFAPVKDLIIETKDKIAPEKIIEFIKNKQYK